MLLGSRRLVLVALARTSSAKRTATVHRQAEAPKVFRCVFRQNSNGGGQRVVPLHETASSDGGKKSGKKHRKWFSISNEWKIVGTALIGIASWYVSSNMERTQNRMQVQMELVTTQLKELYGPLYGNRIVAETSYRAAMKQHGGLKKYLHEAKEKRDSDMIRAWRSYVLNVLYPLDKEAAELLCNHAHLIAEKEFPYEFQRFLEHSAQMQFVMEQWKNDKGQLESTEEMTDSDFMESNNSTGIGDSRPMIEHLSERCRNLRKRQQVYMEEINVDTLTMRIVNKILK